MPTDNLWRKRGLQVIMSYYDDEEYIERAIDSVERSMRGQDWIIIFGEDSEQKGSQSIIRKYSKISSAKKVVHNVYPKALNVSTAKNRAIKEGLRYSREYPGLLIMDADDEMTPERPRLLETAIKYNSAFAVGAWEYEKKIDSFKFMSSSYAASSLAFTSCCTLLHESLIPENGRFFYDKVVSYGDAITWHYLKRIKKITPIAHASEAPVHIHYKITRSVTNPDSYTTLRKKRKIVKILKEYLSLGMDIFDEAPEFRDDDIKI